MPGGEQRMELLLGSVAVSVEIERYLTKLI